MRRLVPLVALAALAGMAGAQLNPKLSAKIGKPLPKFKAKTSTGAPFSNASLKGHPALFDFWASWCGPCKAASPAIQKLHAQFGGKGLMVIGADSFEQGAKGAAAAYKKAHGYTYTFTEGNDDLALALGAETIPAFVLVDGKGIVRKVWTGLPAGGPDELYKQIAAAAKPYL